MKKYKYEVRTFGFKNNYTCSLYKVIRHDQLDLIKHTNYETNTLDHTSTFTSTSATVSFTGLSNYASKTVKVRSGTNYLGEYTVTSGGALTLDAGLETNSITVGYDYSVEIETMPVDAILTTGTLTGLPKRISRVVLGLDSSLTTTLEGDTLILKQVTDDFSLDPSTFTGLKEFYNVTKFVTSDKTIKKQKRNDYED